MVLESVEAQPSLVTETRDYRVFGTAIEGVRIVKLKPHEDLRGVLEVGFHRDQFAELGLPTEWAQETFTQSYKYALRGMHTQRVNPQGKLIRCLMGQVFDCWVDLRPGSRTQGKTESMNLQAFDCTMVYLPPGMGHGFLTLSNYSMFHYLCTTVWDAESSTGVKYDDKDLGIDWPLPPDAVPLTSVGDHLLPTLDAYLASLR